MPPALVIFKFGVVVYEIVRFAVFVTVDVEEPLTYRKDPFAPAAAPPAVVVVPSLTPPIYDDPPPPAPSAQQPECGVLLHLHNIHHLHHLNSGPP